METPLDMSVFWKILEQFPDVRRLSDLTFIIQSLESGTGNEIVETFPNAYWFLKDYESSMRSHIYAEFHAQEYLDDSETT